MTFLKIGYIFSELLHPSSHKPTLLSFTTQWHWLFFFSTIALQKHQKAPPQHHQDKTTQKHLQGHQIRYPSWFEGFDCDPNIRALNKKTCIYIYTSHLELISFIHHYKWSIVLGILCRASSSILRSFSSKSARSMQNVQIAYRATLMRPWRMQGFYPMHLQASGFGKDDEERFFFWSTS